ncbi:MAG: hypothetical protein K1X55_04740 [Chitinophagales bacterium]|nr:hypothetical protein [Chitinophagales bacterium]
MRKIRLNIFGFFALFFAVSSYGQTGSISLLTPLDESESQTNYPIFSWTSVSNTSEGLGDVFYKIKLVEVANGQLPSVAIQNNSVHFSDELEDNTTLVYSTNAPTFTECKTYAWRVVAEEDREVTINEETVVQRFVIATSEVFTFFSYCDQQEIALEAALNNYLIMDKQMNPFIFLVPDAVPTLNFRYTELYNNDSLNVNLWTIDNESKSYILENYVIGEMHHGANFIKIDKEVFIDTPNSEKVYFLEVNSPQGLRYKGKVMFE